MSAVVERPAARPAAGDRSHRFATRRLLAGGAAAGPLFVAVAGIQVLTVDGFDLRRHPLSLLSAGDHGWIQIANFVLAGVLTVGLAVGLRRVWHDGRGRLWGPLLVGAYGAGLVAGGVFVADPALGFPPGAPEGIPTDISWHAAVHSVAPVVAFNAVIIACVVYAVRFAGRRERGWAAYSAATAVGALACAAWPGQDTISWRLGIAVTLAFAWQTALALKASRH
jgi:hypothetical protein